ncbi:MAG: hypothetical protein KAJ37_00920 [Candidatus Krumholzibacteria bacterium]|nr:hypothetical protein [Candidatus Krumholzibacteria bacterium]
MRMFLCSSVTKFISVLLVVCIAAFHVPAEALTPKKSPEDDLKQIQYNYYFRGKYAEAIDALNVFLERGDVDKNLEISAREFLAASYILSGEKSKGKDQFLQILNEHEQYAGPDPTKFKAEVVDAFTTTRDALASVKLRSAPDTGAAGSAAQPASEESSKPIYKKWWFYAAGAATLLLIAGALSSEKKDDPVAQDAGTVSVGVQVR